MYTVLFRRNSRKSAKTQSTRDQTCMTFNLEQDAHPPSHIQTLISLTNGVFRNLGDFENFLHVRTFFQPGLTSTHTATRTEPTFGTKEFERTRSDMSN